MVKVGVSWAFSVFINMLEENRVGRFSPDGKYHIFRLLGMRFLKICKFLGVCLLFVFRRNW